MNTGEWILHIPMKGTVKYWEPWIFCDLCGWSCIGQPAAAPHHFCHRHKLKDIQRFLDGDLPGYEQLENMEPTPNEKMSYQNDSQKAHEAD